MAPAKIEDQVDHLPLVSSGVKTPSDSQFSVYRQLVPVAVNDDITYLNASFAPPSNLVVHEAIARFNHEALHNPSPKAQWQKDAEEVRGLIARYINADPVSVAITRDTTEGLNSFIRSLDFQAGDNVLILDSEHPNHGYGWMALRSAGLEVRQIPTIAEAERTGSVVAANAATFAPYVDDRTRAIGISSVMFHSGQLNDVADICAEFRPKGIHVLADLTQQVGFMPTDVQRLGVSAAAFSTHKGLNCPTGLAFLYVDPVVVKELDPSPPIVGYGAVSNVRSDLLVPSDPIVYHSSTRRYEHLNVSLIAAAAAKAYLKFYLDTMGPKKVEAHLYSLGDKLREECGALGIKIVGPASHREHAPHLYILDLHDARWVALLKDNGIYVTPYRLGIRVSFGFYNNLDDVRVLSKVLKAGQQAGLPVP